MSKLSIQFNVPVTLWYLFSVFTAYLESGFWVAVLNLFVPYYPIWIAAREFVKLVS